MSCVLLLAAGASARGAAWPPLPPRHAGQAAPQRSPLADMPRHSLLPAAGSPWQAFAHMPEFNPGAMLLLTDGSVIIQDQGAMNNSTGNWWRLTPDNTGSYVTGAWSKIAAMPPGYGPLYFASAILPDGRVIVEGGEYNLGQEVWSNQGAIYDPLTDRWRAVAPPAGSMWSRIGDAPSTVLANGTFMLGASGYTTTYAQALLHPVSLLWTSTGAGKADANGEEGWSLLPDGEVLTIDTKNTPQSELYSPLTRSWSSAGATPSALAVGREIGPQILRPNGTLFAAGATGANAVYTVRTKTWSAAPGFPAIGGAQYAAADGAAAILPNGNVLVDAGPGVYQPPTHFWEFDGTALTQVADPPNAANLASFNGFMMVLPTGQILFNPRLGAVLYAYNAAGAAPAAWRPIISSVATSLTPGQSYTLTGLQLNGLTQAAAYGDDYQCATNFPLVRLTIKATGHVFYARTANFTSMAVAPGVKSSASFTLPAGIETGVAWLSAVANGIASQPVRVVIN